MTLRSLLCAAALSCGLCAAAGGTVAASVAPTPETGGGETIPASAPATPPATVTTPDTLAPDGDDDTPWPLIIAIGAGAVALLALVSSLSRRRPAGSGSAVRSPIPPPAPHDRAAQDRGYALGSARWVHDNFSLELLAAAPDRALRRWTADRSRLDDAIIRAQSSSNDPQYGLAWQSLAQSLSLVGSSLDTLIELRTAEHPDARLIDEAAEVVHRHRADLGRDIATLWPSVDR